MLEKRLKNIPMMMNEKNQEVAVVSRPDTILRRHAEFQVATPQFTTFNSQALGTSRSFSYGRPIICIMHLLFIANHVKLLNACYPPTSALLVDCSPNSHELSRLTYYA